MKNILLFLIKVATIPYYVITTFRRNKFLKTSIFLAFIIILLLLFTIGPQNTLRALLVVMQLLMGFVFMIIQFIGLFWFLSRTKAVEILPGDPKTITWDNYWGNEHIVNVVRQWQKLLTDEGKFKSMGGKPIRGILLVGPPGTGKALANSEIVYTSNGYKKVKDVKLGDFLIGSDGKPVKVIGVYPQGKKKIYSIKFNDGNVVKATGDHLWLVADKNKTEKFNHIYSTEEILNLGKQSKEGLHRFYIQNIEPVEFESKDVPLDPYLLGILLLNGNFKYPLCFSSPNKEIIDYVKNHLNTNDKLVKLSKYTYSIEGTGLKQSIKKLGLWKVISETKEIPEIYLYNSVEVRTAILQGLLDIGGSVPTGTYIEYITASKNLMNGIKFLVESLGGIFYHTQEYLNDTNIKQLVYKCNIIWLPQNIISFRLNEKLNKITNIFPIYREFESIEPLGEENATCFLVDSKDHLFATNGFILTHNTLLAKAMAGDSGIAFYGQEGSSFTSMFFGVGVLKIMAFFRKGRQLAKQFGACILFLDEIDAIGRSRGGTGAQNQPGFAGGIFGGIGAMGLLTRLLYEMDGIEDLSLWDQCENKIRKFLGVEEINQGTIMVLGSTNIAEVLDPALTRPGRFDRKIYIDLPDKKSRKAIIEGYLKTISHDPNISVEELVQITPHVTPAQIASAITKDAVRLAFFDGRDYVTQRDIEDALEEQVLGIPNPIADFDPEQKRQVAIHEAGHAIVQHFVRPDERIVRVSIVRRGGALGYMLPVSKVDLYTLPLDVFIRDIMVSLAGHVATELVLGKPWTGAGGDLMAVRSRVMLLASHGMFGSFPIDPSGKFEYDPETRKLVDIFLKDCLQKTKEILEQHRKALDALIEALLEKDDLLGKEVVEIIERAEMEVK